MSRADLELMVMELLARVGALEMRLDVREQRTPSPQIVHAVGRGFQIDGGGNLLPEPVPNTPPLPWHPV